MYRKGQTKTVSQPSAIKKLDERVFIGMLGIDCVNYSKQAIDSIRSNAKELFCMYMDNGSTEESIDIINSWDIKNPSITKHSIFLNGKNIGVAAGWNLLCKVALEWSATKIIICNNDIVFHSKTIDNLCEAYNRIREEDPRTVMVTASNKVRDPSRLEVFQPEWSYAESPDFSCFMITPETIERVGLFDEQFSPAYFEDNEFHHRLLLQGWKAYGTAWAPYCHYGSRTRNSHHDIVTHDMFRENRMKFFKKMMVNATEQDVSVARYSAWLEANHDKPHPNYVDVLDWCEKNDKL